MKDYLQGAYDLHIHCGPDVLPRKVTALEMAKRAVDCGMKGFAIKSHYAQTCLQAAAVRDIYPDCNAVGTLVLNSAVGGTNPMAVETAARMGAKIIWCPTFDSPGQRAYYLKNLPQYIGMQKKFLDNQIDIPAVALVDANGELLEAMKIILKLAKEYKMAVGTGHISHEETFALAKEARRIGFQKLIITHADWEFTHYSVEEQKALAGMGAYIEHSYTSPAEGAVPWEQVFREIREIGVEHCFITTDLGKMAGDYPEIGLVDYAKRLAHGGFSDEEIGIMMREVPAYLIEG